MVTIKDMNNSNYEDNKGTAHDDRPNRELTIALLADHLKYHNYNCTITNCDRYGYSDIEVKFDNGEVIYIDCKSVNQNSNTPMKIGYNATDHDKFISSTHDNVRIAMIYTDMICFYDIKHPYFQRYDFTRSVNDRADGYIKDKPFVQLNNNEPTLRLKYYTPKLKNVTPDENNVVQLGYVQLQY